MAFNEEKQVDSKSRPHSNDRTILVTIEVLQRWIMPQERIMNHILMELSLDYHEIGVNKEILDEACSNWIQTFMCSRIRPMI